MCSRVTALLRWCVLPVDISTLSVPVFLGFILYVEYALKQWAESLRWPSGQITARHYVIYRFVHAALLCAGAALIFAPWQHAVVVATVAIVVGCVEVPIHYSLVAARSVVPVRFRWGNLLGLICLLAVPAIVLIAKPVAFTPWFDASVVALAELLDVSPTAVIIVVLGYIAVAQPTNYLIRWLIGKEADRTLPEMLPASEVAKSSILAQTASTTDSGTRLLGEDELRAGRIIGVLERWLIVTLLLVSQYSLIGLVLTAKSIVRFPKFETVPTFAEYYLLGTLYSTFIALIAGLWLRSLLF